MKIFVYVVGNGPMAVVDLPVDTLPKVGETFQISLNDPILEEHPEGAGNQMRGKRFKVTVSDGKTYYWGKYTGLPNLNVKEVPEPC